MAEHTQEIHSSLPTITSAPAFAPKHDQDVSFVNKPQDLRAKQPDHYSALALVQEQQPKPSAQPKPESNVQPLKHAVGPPAEERPRVLEVAEAGVGGLFDIARSLRDSKK